MQMYALCKQPFLLQVKSQFLESHTEETIKAAPRLRLASDQHVRHRSPRIQSRSLIGFIRSCLIWNLHNEYLMPALSVPGTP